MIDKNNLMLNYIREQGELLRKYKNNTIRNLSFENNYSKIIITGTGSSLNAIRIAIDALQLNSEKVEVYNPFDLRYRTRKLADSNNLIILVSQSGESTSIIDCALTAKNNGLDTISITSGKSNTLAKIVEVSIDIEVGDENIGPKTKGVLFTSIIIISLLKKILSNKNQYAIPIVSNDRIEELINSTIKSIDIHKEFHLAQGLSIFGFGLDDSICQEGALKLLETMMIPVMNYPGEEFMHGPHRVMQKDEKFIILNSDNNEYCNGMINYARNKEVDLFLISNNKDSDIIVNNWIESLIVFQIMAYYLPLKKGLDPSEPVNADFAKKVGSRTG